MVFVSPFVEDRVWVLSVECCVTRSARPRFETILLRSPAASGETVSRPNTPGKRTAVSCEWTLSGIPMYIIVVGWKECGPGVRGEMMKREWRIRLFIISEKTQVLVRREGGLECGGLPPLSQTFQP